MAKLEVHKWRYCIDIVLIPQSSRLLSVDAELVKQGLVLVC